MKSLLAMSNEDPRKIVAVAVILCLVCSVLVSTTAVVLKPFQEHNKTLAMRGEILRISGLPADGGTIAERFQQIETRIVDLNTGEYVAGIDPESYDQRAAAKDPGMSSALAPDEDVANIRRRARFAPVYLVHEDERVVTVILPIHGQGLWSSMYGFIALAADGRTIRGITFFEQGETPGLGDGIVDRDWQRQFVNKLAFDDEGRVKIRLVKGGIKTLPVRGRLPSGSTAGAAASAASYQVDALAGATLTSRGVTNLLHFWLGADGFGPYLKKLAAGGGG